MLIVNPNHRLNTELAAVEPPLWAGLCAAYHNADILDAEAFNMNLVETEFVIRKSGQKDILIVVMGNNPSVSSTPKMLIAEALAERIKDLNVSLTGIHPIAVGSSFPVVRKPFEGFPSIQWEKLPMNMYRAHNWHCLDGSPRSPYASVYTSLGCPFDCYYCNIHTLYGNRQVQFRPIEDILKEVNTLATQYKVKNIKIWDELFALDEKRVLSICSGLKDYDLNIWAYARLDTITEKMLKVMKRAGINWVAYGFESIRDKKFVYETEEIVKMTKAAGINIIANFMFGMYWQYATAEDDWATFQWAKDQLFEFVNFYYALPYPGSQWYNDEITLKSGTKWMGKWELYNQYGGIKGFRDDYKVKHPFSKEVAFIDYFTNPAYLEYIKSKFGQQAIEQIEDMLKQEVGYA